MRNLTIRPQIQNFEIDMLEKLFQKPIPPGAGPFLQKYAGLSPYERVYIDKNGESWGLSQFNLFKDIYGLGEEFMKVGWGKYLAFAYDDGGWHFCICMDDKDYGAIYINRWTDHLPHEQFLKIADSFEAFIMALQQDPNFPMPV